MRKDSTYSICKKAIILLFLLIINFHSALAQNISIKDIANAWNIENRNVVYTIPSDLVPQANSCAWEIDGKVATETKGVTISADSRSITIPMSNYLRKVSVAITYADNTTQNLNFEVEPKVYGEDYDGQHFYADSFAGGSGTVDNPYIISNDLQLALLARNVSKALGESVKKDAKNTNQIYSGIYFKLSQDIDLGYGVWMPIGSWTPATPNFFAGKLDGDGNTIRNMQIYWTNADNQEASWGLFSRLYGNSTDAKGFAEVSNIVIENASVAKKIDYKPVGSGTIKLGIIAGDLTNNAEISNIIIKKSEVSDNDETYNTENKYRVGGIVGYLDNFQQFRIFNISADTKMNMLKNASFNNKNKGEMTISGGFGFASRFGNKSYSIAPTNIYVHGPEMVTNSNTSKCKRGSVAAFYSTYNFTAEQEKTLYYSPDNKVTGDNINLNGTEKDLVSFGEEFVSQTNKYLKDKNLNKKNWSFSATGKEFSFNLNILRVERGTTDKLTVETKDGQISDAMFDWFVSNDNINWQNLNTEKCNSFSLPRQIYNQYVYATDGISRTNVAVVKAIGMTATLDKETTLGTYIVDVVNDTEYSNTALGLNITYEWYNGTTLISNPSAEPNVFVRPADATHNDRYNCHVIVKTGDLLLLDHWFNTTTVVYLKPTDTANESMSEDKRTADKDWGYSEDKPMLTWKGAYSKLSKNGSWNENFIVLIGASSATVTNDISNGFNITPNYQSEKMMKLTDWENAKNSSPLFRNVTITGKWNGKDYDGRIEIFGATKGLPIWGDTRFQDLTFYNDKNTKGSDYYKNIYCQYHNIEMGKGLKMKGFYKNSPEYGTIDGAITTAFQIFGGFSNDGRFYPLNTKENIEAFEKSMPHGKEGFSIKIQSGFYSTICVGGRQTAKITSVEDDNTYNGVMGTPNMPIKCTIDIDIDRAWNTENNEIRDVEIYDIDSKKYITQTNKQSDYDVGVILAGTHEGAIYADVDIIIRSGNIARVVNGTLGNERNLSFIYPENGGTEYHVPNNSFMGRANITLDPASSENNNDTNINNRIIVTELYGGSTGRGHTGDITINNPFYGYSTISINGGTFKILPEGNTRKDYIFSGIYGAGAGGMNGIGYGADNATTHTPDQSIPYWNDTKDVMLYGPYSVAKDNLIEYQCYNAKDHNITIVNPKETSSKIEINGGVFGSAVEPIDGIYAGGSGYMSKGLWTFKAIPSKDGGNVYGEKNKTVTSLTINGGTFYCENGVFAGGRGTDYYYSENPYGGSASNYTDLGKTYGNVELNINGGKFYCDVFGGGYGVADTKLYGTNNINTLSNMARIYGKSNVNIYGGTFYKNVYGGGDMAVVEYQGEGNATNVVIGDGADIRGSVFAGGNGRPLRPATATTAGNDGYTQKPDSVGLVKGTTSVTFTGSTMLAPYVYGNIYGGGNMAQVSKDTHVNIYAANFAGQVFGAGNGNIADNTITSANVLGNTYVSLAEDMSNQEDGNDGKKMDNFSINVIWDRLWDNVENRFYGWNSAASNDIHNEEEKNNFIADVTKFFDNGIYLNPHNIYGGGNLACVVGSYEVVDGKETLKAGTGIANVEVLKGMTPYSLLATQQWKDSYDDNDHPHFSVFGGGYGENTIVGSTIVDVNVVGDYTIYNTEIDDDTEQLSKDHPFFEGEQPSNRLSLSDGVSMPVAPVSPVAPIASNSNITIFDNSKGIPNFTVLGVLGGGYAGIVKGNTKVTIDGNTFLHRVYGGGFGDPNSIIDNITGQIGGNTKVYVKGGNTYGDIFGGGAGVAPKAVNDEPFIKVARVCQTTMVEVSDDANVYGRVFGGGDMANVGPEAYTPDYTDIATSCTTIDIKGGNIFGSVFGGGKGLLQADVTDYEKVGRINGNTYVHVINTNATSTTSIDKQGNNVPCIWNSIYGGCAYGTVDGNTQVHIEGGMLGANVYGGGYGDIEIEKENTATEEVLGKKDTDQKGTYANILGNTKVLMDGGSWIWNRKADTKGNITTWLATQAKGEKICNNEKEFLLIVNDIINAKSIADLKYDKAKAALTRIANDKDTKEFFEINEGTIHSGRFKKNHNIYGGGNRACYVGYDKNGNKTTTPTGTIDSNTGKAEVEINHSPLTEIKDSDNESISMLDGTTLQGLCWYLASKNASYPQFSVFGAGYGVNTKVRNTEVKAQPGNIFDKNIRYLNQESDMKIYQTFIDKLYSDFQAVSSEDKKKYYGSVDGTESDPNTFRRYFDSRMSWCLGIPNFTFLDIHGGGFSGYVEENTNVTADNRLACNNIYGAGLGAKPFGTLSADSNTDDYDFGSVGGNSNVEILAGCVSKNVYGGGAGVESILLADNSFADFKNMARVKGRTEVHVTGEIIGSAPQYHNRTLIIGSIYGGGDVANVGMDKDEALAAELSLDDISSSSTTKFTSLVDVHGGTILSPIFAGGKGRTADKCNDYKLLGGIYGNACVITNKDTKGTSSELPYILNRIYGGCQNGTIYGNTLVAIKDGYIYHGIYGGGWGNATTNTSADITGNTNLFVIGGQARLISYWLEERRTWEPATILEGKTYSPQYNPETKKFKVNHNIYGGGNEACIVGKKDADGKLVANSGNTYLTMKKGLLYDNTAVLSGTETDAFFSSEEWKQIYYKVGSPHFCVFGGGYGEQTIVLGDTHVNIAMEGRGSTIDPKLDLVKGQEHKHFYSGYSVMDFVGGGYAGKVEGETNVTGKGGAFCRRIFGGGFYNSVSKTHVNIEAIDCHDIFGGGMMGDVLLSTEVNIGRKMSSAEGSTYSNKDIFIHGNVYGGNDVSGYVNVNDKDGYFADNGGDGTHINIFGGRIDGDVYGAGNGDYLYALDRQGNKQVTVNENYPLNINDPNSETTELVFTVPMRESMPSPMAASDAAKMVNINSWRPLTNKVNINISGNNTKDTILIKGDVYCGGNSASVQKVQEAGNKTAEALSGNVNIKIGSYVNIRSVFMGCNGDAFFTASENNNFMNKFQKLNGDYHDSSKELNFADTIDWINDPSNKGIDFLYLPTKNEERPLVYPHLIDLYFQPVEMNIQGKLTWGDDLTNCTIGSFFCGGNRGNMNVYPDAEGNVVDYTFPKGLTITEKIVGGCNNANYDYKGRVTHEGGYLLGLAHSTKPFIKLTIQNNFSPKVVNGAYQGGCVYGGCFKTGTMRGDVTIDLQSDMLAGKSMAKLNAANDSLASNPDFSSLNIYGAGYGMESYVYGNTRIIMGKNIKCVEPKMNGDKFLACGVKDATTNPEGFGVSANFVYGGGQQGNVIGLTNVDIYNGHVYRSVTGGSYSGYVYGSTQVKVGYPTYYKVNKLKNGNYLLKRTDRHNLDLKNNNGTTETPTIKQNIHLLAGELISQGVYDDIDSFDNGTVVKIDNKQEYFTKVEASEPSVDWDNVNIHIDEAIYGGGYSLAQGASVMANDTTVLKLTNEFNVNKAFTNSEEHLSELLALPGATTAGFGGNTLILVGDKKDSEHITISQQDMKEVNLPKGTDLYGYYYRYYKDDEHNQNQKYTYRFISTQEKYFKGDNIPEGLTELRENKFYEYDSEGGIFGDGHLSYAQGFRSADITGYGFAEHTIEDPKIINTFQRMDILRLEDNCFALLGARDYTVNEINKTPYSIARVGEIKMVASDIKLVDGKLQTRNDITPEYSSQARNYMGLVNNIHYVGAVNSNIQFSDIWHDNNGSPAADNKSYQQEKERYIKNFIDGKKEDVSEFQKRNNGTAKNMIGIASGYALKIQNVQEVFDNDKKKTTEKIYYGPVYGIIEMNLVYVRPDEGGGYVYADNIHERSDNGEKQFLNTTGNFVFPFENNENRYIIDDCSPTGFFALKENGLDPDTNADIHYWYVTGFNYYFNAHITGYTYKKHITFANDNSDGLTALAGLKAGQKVSIKSWKMRSGHEESYECDLEDYASDKYQLFVGASSSNSYDGPTSATDDKKNGFAAILSMSKNAESNNYATTYLSESLPTTLNGEAKVAFMLVDDNPDNADPDYYNKHLSKKCQATLVLEAPALDEKGNQRKDDKGNPKNYTYTIYLTIEYVQGPNILGNITIDNCALPGEMIRLKKNKVKIAADQAFSANGYYWHIGKLKKDENGKNTTEFDDATTSWLTNTSSKNTYKQGDKIDNKRTDLFAGCVYDKTGDYLDIPAYYFMNGYGVQLGITMNGFPDTVFPVDIATGDTLVVHNYHEMDPHKSNINLHLAEAIQRAKDDKSFAEPRIYISDISDMKAFVSFLDTIGTNSSAPRYGANAQFVLQDDLSLPSDYDGSKAIFAGILHGNGHIIRDLAQSKSLISENQGHIYNLGMVSGNIAAKGNTNGGSYHCCFEQNPSLSDGVSTPFAPIVYDILGTPDHTYTQADFKYGRVAYDLNAYYLKARISNDANNPADMAALKYVYDYYANGDYQYAHRADSITGKNTGITYLRIGKDSNLPNYEQASTRHDKTHTIDKARIAPSSTTSLLAPSSSSSSLFNSISTPFAYVPLFNTNHADTSGANDMNDFLFWGQWLQSTPESCPRAIDSHQNKYMTNRVYRTTAYYGSTQPSKYHYNAYNHDTKNMGTYVHIPSTTAIDFTADDDNATTFYDFTVKDGVTQNLLVYTHQNEATNDAYSIVNKALKYTESTKESLIKGHHIVETKDATGNTTYSTPLLHLVERTHNSINSEGDICENNDFCVPTPFTVTNHAWYVRKPMYYANETTGAWEGICLPFTVHKAEASLNGDITHFYGTPTDEELSNPASNTHTLHHEYWLRGLTSIEQAGTEPAAIFKRPGATKDGLFMPTAEGSSSPSLSEGSSSPSLSEGVSYAFANSFFIDTYGKYSYNQAANSYYANPHTYEDYPLLTSGVPYIVRFPGERYYEFDLSSKFYSNIFSKNEATQTITFNAYGSDNTMEKSYGAILIPKATDIGTKNIDGYSHMGTFAATAVATNDIYGMNAEGTAFDDASPLSTIMPFRTYMAPATTKAKNGYTQVPSVIRIAETAGIETITPEVNGNDADIASDSYLIVRPISNHRVRIESTYSIQLQVFTPQGQLYRILDIQPGIATYSGFQPGLYIFGRTKAMVK